MGTSATKQLALVKKAAITITTAPAPASIAPASLASASPSLKAKRLAIVMENLRSVTAPENVSALVTTKAINVIAAY